MRMNKYKYEMIKKDIIRISIVFVSIILIVYICLVIIIGNETEQLYLEGEVKSAPLITNEMSRKLGDVYVNLNREFERQIKSMEIGYANRKNKRGDIIYYGVNGKENIDEMINEDYVNGIESINYLSSDENRKNGEINFIDMLSVLHSTLGADIDKYEEDDIVELFTRLFWLSHTFTGESTELYPCEHGCSWCKYYCGDIKCQGELAGDTVGFYRSDKYKGNDGEYGLMYDPFLVSKRYNYRGLIEMAGDESKLYTIYSNVGNYKRRPRSESVSFIDDNRTARAVAEDDEIFLLTEPEDYCNVCAYSHRPYTHTTKQIGGCQSDLTCYHGRPKVEYDEGVVRQIIMHYMGSARIGGCDNYEANWECNWEPPEGGEGEDDDDDGGGEDIIHTCTDPIIGCDGYYECLGHDHYACPGHIIVTCFGHTNLRLNIKIMYYEEMLDEFKKILP